MASRVSTVSLRSLAKSKIVLTLGCVALAFACFFVSRMVVIRHIASAQVLVTPFVLEVDTYYFGNDPQGELISRKTVARRSDGTTVEVSPIGQFAWGQMGRKVTYLDGRVVSLVDSVAAKTSWPLMSTQQIAWLKNQMLRPPRNCVAVGETLLGYQTLMNETVARVRNASVPSLEPTTYWRAPDLGCQTLQFRVESTQPDGSSSVLTEGRPVSLKLQDPDSRLFDEGGNYAELKPSEVQRRFLARMGVPEDSQLRQQGESLDGRYVGTH